jgi:hypothetical protein
MVASLWKHGELWTVHLAHVPSGLPVALQAIRTAEMGAKVIVDYISAVAGGRMASFGSGTARGGR